VDTRFKKNGSQMIKLYYDLLDVQCT